MAQGAAAGGAMVVCATRQDMRFIRWLCHFSRRRRRLRPKYVPETMRLVHGRWHDLRMAEDHVSHKKRERQPP